MARATTRALVGAVEQGQAEVGLKAGCHHAGACRRRGASTLVPTPLTQPRLPLPVPLGQQQPQLLVVAALLALLEIRVSTVWRHRGRAEPSAVA